MKIIVYTRRHRTKVAALLLALVRSLHTRSHIRWKIFTEMNYYFYKYNNTYKYLWDFGVYHTI